MTVRSTTRERLSGRARETRLECGQIARDWARIVKRAKLEGYRLTHSYDEVQVYNGVAERTGTRVQRAGVRGRRGVCHSVGQLGSKARQLGDGYYYLISAAWPEGQDTVDLNRTWTSLA